MVTNQVLVEKKADIKVCPLCKRELPLFTDDGHHNFCPHSLKGNITDICVECKMKQPNANTTVGPVN